jgi:hypothetical protein
MIMNRIYNFSFFMGRLDPALLIGRTGSGKIDSAAYFFKLSVCGVPAAQVS